MNNKKWADEVADYISASGLSMRAFAMDIGVPYRTVQDWRAGRRVADPTVQLGLRSLMERYLNVQLVPVSGGAHISIKFSNSVIDSLESIDGQFGSLKVCRVDDEDFKFWQGSQTYEVRFLDSDTGYRVRFK